MRAFYVLFLSFLSLVSSFEYTDQAVVPNATDHHYTRYVTFLSIDTRTYSCPSGNNTTFTLQTFDYDLFDAITDPNSITPLGKHILLLQADSQWGKSVFYTANNTFTYWVGLTTLLLPDSSSNSTLDLSLEQEFGTERSQPKPEAGNYDMGVAEYSSRFGAVGGNPAAGTNCTGSIMVPSRTYYSMWKESHD